MKIALFGGAFDPPHLGHLQVIINLFENKLADEVWLVPTGTHDFQKQMQPASIRLKMLEMLVDQLPLEYRDKVRIEQCELEREGVSHTIDTLNQLSKQHSHDDLYFVIGSDNLEKFHLWERYLEILERYPVIVYPRINYPFDSIYEGMIPLSGVKQILASSTEIRKRLIEQESVEDMLPQEILDFIQKERLYLSR